VRGDPGGELQIIHPLHFFLEIPVLLLETIFILCQEAVKVMEQHPIKDGPLRMSRMIDSCMAGEELKSGKSPGPER